MTNLKVEIAGLRVRDMYPRQIPDLFDGDQILLVGRYNVEDASRLPTREAGVYHTQLVIKGIFQGRERGFEYPVEIRPGGKDLRYCFVEKIWAVRRVGFLLDEIQLRGKSQEIIDELIRLSRDYGIMTPYTSFLADERTELAKDSSLRYSGGVAVNKLGTISGIEGQMGAKNRQALNEAKQPAAPTRSPSLVAGLPAGSAPAESSGYMYGNTSGKAYEQNKRESVANVQNVGNQALYRRGNTWMTPQTAKLDIAKDQAKIKTIERFSTEYFELVRANTVPENQVMATQAPGEQLLVEFRGQAYLIK
jgi:Ca-activated chloride channel family protein